MKSAIITILITITIMTIMIAHDNMIVEYIRLSKQNHEFVNVIDKQREVISIQSDIIASQKTIINKLKANLKYPDFHVIAIDDL